MESRTRYACLGLSVLLVIGGTLATGVVPSTLPAQALAGGVIVAGFLLVYVCLGRD